MKSVSVIIRAYNAEKYIRQAINSILYQDFNGFIEIIICYDEGTRDNTLDIIKSFSSHIYENRAIIICKHTHLTPFQSLQYGLSYSKGDYITILDYDNFMPSSYISTMIKNAECSNALFVFSNSLPIDENGKIIGTKRPQSFNFTLKDLILMNYIDGNTIMLHKDYAEKIKGELDSLNKRRFFDDIHEDWLIALLALKDCKPCFVEEAFIFYRIHSENICAGVGDLYKILNNLKKDISTLLAFYELRGNDLSKEELRTLQLSLIRRYIWSMRYLYKYKSELKIIGNYSFLVTIFRKVFEKLLL